MLAQIGPKVLAAGGRLLVVCADGVQREGLDQALWTVSPTSFLPHGQEDAPDQPILLSGDTHAANGARAIALADGRWRDEALGFERAFHLFDDAAVADARQAWRALGKRADVTRAFWQRGAEGGWTRSA